VQVTRAQDGRALDRAATRERPQPRGQLGEGEGLGQVVVGAGVQALHPVLHRVTGREHEHRSPDPVGAQAPADLEAVHARQHHVEDDDVVLGRAGHPQRVLALARKVGGQAVGAQAAPDQGGQLQLVFDDQVAHGLQSAARR
jgi:hypothetical protein